MSPEIQAAIREIEAQRADLLFGLSIGQAYEKMASRAAEACFAAAKAQAEAAQLRVSLKETMEELQKLRDAAQRPPEAAEEAMG